MALKLLIVDDEAVIVETCRRFFTARGHAAKGAASAEEGIAMAGAERFDAIILDSVLPGMSGLRAIGEFTRRGNPVVVIMTGHYDLELRKDALMLGASEALSKPVDFMELERRVLELVNERQSSRPPAPPAKEL